MPRPACGRAAQFFAAAALATSLLAPAAARPQQKQPTHKQAQEQDLYDQVDTLSRQVQELKEKATDAAKERAYVERIRTDTKEFYQEALHSQDRTLIIAGIIVAVLFGLTAWLGFDIFDNRIEQAISTARTALETTLKERLADERRKLKRSNDEQLRNLENDLNCRSYYNFYFAQGQAAGADGRTEGALNSFRWALKTYRSGKDRLFKPENGGRAIRNIFIAIQKLHPTNFLEEASVELAGELYNDLDHELNYAAVRLDWLRPLVEQRLPTGPKRGPPLSLQRSRARRRRTNRSQRQIDQDIATNPNSTHRRYDRLLLPPRLPASSPETIMNAETREHAIAIAAAIFAARDSHR
jgi:outer membrane murein-binding lipoprotein Lpp